MKNDYKYEFLKQLFTTAAGKKLSILDLGSGTSANFLPFVRGNHLVQYTGIEYYEPSAAKAAELFKGVPNAKFIKGFGEDGGSSLEGQFDIVISLSVLEHVKHLDDFLKQSVRFGSPGAMIIHRYDLGHSLYPSSFKEQLGVWASKSFPFLVSKRSFTTHPSLPQIIEQLTKYGVDNIKVDYGQVCALKKMMNKVKVGEEALATDLLKMEAFLKEHFVYRLSQREKEYLFPTITITGLKR